MSPRIKLAGLALAAVFATGTAQAEDSGFATKSITNLGLTGGGPATNGNANGESGRSTSNVVPPPPQVRNGGSFGTPAAGAVGTGPGVPAPGGGSFAAPASR